MEPKQELHWKGQVDCIFVRDRLRGVVNWWVSDM